MALMRNLFLFLFPLAILAQSDDLLGELETELVFQEERVTSVFKGIKIINFESTKLVGKKQLQFVLYHRFGSLDDGVDNFFGLDDASVRVQFIYGATDWLNFGVSRSGFNKSYDITAKYRLISQKKNAFPVTVVGFNLAYVNTDLDSDLLPGLSFSDRLGYTNQLLISRKFNDWLSFQLSPTFFHDNTVQEENQQNSQFAIGIGGRIKLTKRLAIIGDYGIHLNRVDNSIFNNPLAAGVEIETGGHVFQLHVSNARAIFANGFLGQSRGDFTNGTIFLGFNLTRAFSL